MYLYKSFLRKAAQMGRATKQYLLEKQIVTPWILKKKVVKFKIGRKIFANKKLKKIAKNI